jgi:hypothetical protein
MKLKFERKSLSKPTPQKMRLLGNTLMVIGTTIAGSIYNETPWVAVLAFVLGLIGKGLTEFFIEE